jgi:xanthine phosphoribosyltransferase
MKALNDRILREGQNLGNGILKVDSFLNHQVDSGLMALMGREFARRFGYLKPTKVLTAEISGIAPALQTGVALDVPVIFARKIRSITLPKNAFERTVPSRTKGGQTLLLVSPEYLKPGDRVVIIDDFLATGQTTEALASIVQEAGATLVGIGVVIEKSFESGRQRLARFGVPIESLAVVERMEGDRIVLAGRET